MINIYCFYGFHAEVESGVAVNLSAYSTAIYRPMRTVPEPAAIGWSPALSSLVTASPIHAVPLLPLMILMVAPLIVDSDSYSTVNIQCVRVRTTDMGSHVAFDVLTNILTLAPTYTL
jgi:hypothetical protein